MKNLTAQEAANKDMKDEFDTLISEDTLKVHREPVKELYSKSIEFIPNKGHGVRTTIGFINFNPRSHE